MSREEWRDEDAKLIKFYEIPDYGEIEIYEKERIWPLEEKVIKKYNASIHRNGWCRETGYNLSVKEVENETLKFAKEDLEKDKKKIDSVLEFIAKKMEENNYTPQINDGEGK